MMNMRVSPLIFVLPAVTICMVAQPAVAKPKDILIDSADLVVSFASPKRDNRIPPEIIQQAEGIAIFPSIVSAGFIVGGAGGSGSLTIRDDQGRWGNPLIVSVSSGSIGLQAGAQSSDIILVFMTKNSVRTMLRESFTLGGNVSVAAGPVGGSAVTPADSPDSDIYSYTRSQGLFAGVSLEGAKVAYDQDGTEELYQSEDLSAEQAYSDRTLPTSPEIQELQQTLDNAQK